MSIFEYDKELEEKKLRKAEFEAGREIGHEAGLAETIYGKMQKKPEQDKKEFYSQRTKGKPKL